MFEGDGLGDNEPIYTSIVDEKTGAEVYKDNNGRVYAKDFSYCGTYT